MEQLRPSKRYTYELWKGREILVGEEWGSEVQDAVESCDVALLFVTPTFLASKYIDEQDLSRLMDADRALRVPVLFAPVDLNRHDLKGLGADRLFRFAREAKQHAYTDCRTNESRQALRT